MAETLGVRKYSRDLVTDLSNIASGGAINPMSTIKRELESRIPDPVPDRGGWYMGRENRRTKSFSEAKEVALEKAMKYQQNVVDFLGSIDVNKFPGNSPLEKSMNLLKLLTSKKGEPSESGDDPALPIFNETESPEKEARDLERLMDKVDSLDNVERELLDEEKKEGEDDEGYRMRVAEDMVKKETILEISRNLDKLTRMQVRKSKKQEPDPEGDEVRFRPIEAPGEMKRLDKREFCNPQNYLLYRVITGAAVVK